MKKLRKAFDKNDHDRFQQWLSKLNKHDPTVKINTKTLHPHELVQQYLKTSGWHMNMSIDSDPVIEAQWKALEENVRKMVRYLTQL